MREQETNSTTLAPGVLPQQAIVDQTRLRSELAMVQVIVSDAAGDAYRETRFYREEPEGWLRTSPAPAFWGREQVLETAHFRIHYRQADARAVADASEQLDKIYVGLRKDLGLPDSHEMLSVEVAPVSLNALRFLQFEDNHLIVPSPLLLQAPADLADNAVLVQTVTPALVDQVWNDALYPATGDRQWYGIRPEWSSMLRGMQIWQAYASRELPAHWYADTTNWLYRDAPVIRSGQRAPTFLDLQTLCREDSIWRYNVPSAVSLASLCIDPDWRLHLKYMPAAPVALGQLVDFMDWETTPSSALYGDWMRSIAASTVVDYFVYTYGREQLPLLVDGFRSHDSWEPLIPDLLGISAQEFETGWRAYLAEQYGFEDGMQEEEAGFTVR